MCSSQDRDSWIKDATAKIGKMTPAQSVRAECRRCKGGQVFRCGSKICALNLPGRPLPKIKAHCRVCNGDDHPRECTGRFLGGTVCNLHEFRLGKNRHAKKRILSPERKAQLVASGRKHQFGTGQNTPFSTPGSTISLPGVPEGVK